MRYGEFIAAKAVANMTYAPRSGSCAQICIAVLSGLPNGQSMDTHTLCEKTGYPAHHITNALKAPMKFGLVGRTRGSRSHATGGSFQWTWFLLVRGIEIVPAPAPVPWVRKRTPNSIFDACVPDWLASRRPTLGTKSR